jgi:predicted RNase H-like HicB family nuclease
MPTVIYPAIARGSRATGYTATFPDLPGASASGVDHADLLSKARDALRAHLSRMAEDDQDWPDPSDVDQVAAPAGEGPASVILVDVQIEESPVRVNISIGERLLRRIDEAAERRGMTRSGFIAAAARQALGDSWQNPASQGAGWTRADWEAASKRLQEEMSAMGRRLNENLGPDSTFARNMADLDDRLSDVIRRTADSVAAAVRRRQAERHTPGTPGSAAADDEAPRHDA